MQLKQSRRKNIRQERKGVAQQGLKLRRLSGDDLKPHHWDSFYTFYRNTTGWDSFPALSGCTSPWRHLLANSPARFDRLGLCRFNAQHTEFEECC